MGKRKENHRRRSSSSDNDDDIVCPCGKATGSSYWIQCDGCEIWYHGKCAKFTEKETSMVDKFYCERCISENSSWKTTYKPGFVPKRNRDLDFKEDVSLNASVKKLSEVEPQVIRESTKLSDAQKFEDRRRLAAIQDTILKQRAKDFGRCGICSACFRSTNCDVCINCYSDKMCIKRICIHRAMLEKQETPEKAGYDKSQEKLKEVITKMDGENLFYGKDKVTARLSNNDDIRQCEGPECIYQSRPGSKYCSHECGLNRARLRLLVVLPVRVKDYLKDPPATFQRLQKDIADHLEKQKELENELATVSNTRAYFADYVKKLEEIDKERQSEEDDEENETNKVVESEEPGTGFCGRCPICGNLSTSYGALQKHIMRCYFRIEKRTCFVGPYPQTQNPEDIICDVYCKQQSAYCKRLKVLCFDHYKGFLTAKETICGAPLGIYESGDTINLKQSLKTTDIMAKGYCSATKDDCDKHHNWGIALLGSLDNYRISLIRRTEEVKTRIKQFREQYNRRYDVPTLLTNYRVTEDTDRYGMPKNLDVTKDYPEYMSQKIDWTPEVAQINAKLQKKLDDRYAEAQRRKEAEKAKMEALKRAKVKPKRAIAKKKNTVTQRSKSIAASKNNDRDTVSGDTPRRSISKDTSYAPATPILPGITSDSQTPVAQPIPMDYIMDNNI